MNYQELWERFMKGDHVSQAMFPDDGTVGLALVMPVENKGITERAIAIQRKIGEVVSFIQVPRDALHITVTVFGNLEKEATGQMGLSRDQLSVFARCIGDALKKTGRFQINLKQVSSFFTCAFVEVIDDGAIKMMGGKVEKTTNTLRVWEQDYGGGMQYIPHMTIGYYGENGNGAAVRKILSELRGSELGVMSVDRVRLVTAEWQKGRYRLKRVGEYELS